MTRTYTRFFSDASLSAVTADVAELAADFEQRARSMDTDVARAGRERITALTLALERLRDRAEG
jgi:hypothetical protein